MFAIDKVRTVHDGWGRFLIATVHNQAGARFERQIEDHGSAVCVLPYDPVRRCVTLVRQARIGPLYLGAEPMLIEAPAGLTDGEEPEAAGRREVAEETGLRLGTMEPAGAYWSMPGCATERMHFFLAAYEAADRVSDGGGVAHEHEDIEVIEVAIADALAMLRDGRICDMKTVLVLQALALGHSELIQPALSLRA